MDAGTAVTLVIPDSGFLIEPRVFPSLGVLKVAAALEATGISVRVADFSGRPEIDSIPDADVYGITATMPQMPAAIRIAERIRKDTPHARIILGGPHVTLMQASARIEQKKGVRGRASVAMDQLYERFDVLVAGDGERAILEAIKLDSPRMIDGDDLKSPLFLNSPDLNAAPLPARHLIDIQSYKYQIDGIDTQSLIGQLGCPMGCTFSVTGDTLVITDYGPIEIRELASGIGAVRNCVHGPSMLEYSVSQMVATPVGRALATKAVAEGVHPVMKVTVEGGLSIKATPEHRFICAENEALVWRKTNELKEGDVMVIRRPDREWSTDYQPLTRPVIPPTPPGGYELRDHRMPLVLDEKLAWLAGFVVGDGSLPTDGRPSFHVCITDGVEERLIEIMRECFNVKLSVRPASNTVNMKHGWVHSRLAREVLIQSLGIDPADKLKIPSIFWRSPKTVLSAFIDGLFAADGYEEAPGRHYVVTVSERLAREVALAMLMLGRGCPTIKRIESLGGYGGPGLHISFRVGLLHNDRIPTTRAVYKSNKSGLWYWRTFRNAKHGLGVRRRTLRESGLNHPLDRDGWHYVHVTSVVHCLSEPVYDITVPGEEAFVANGFIAHNCGGRRSPFLRKVRMRDTAHVIGELRHLYQRYGTRGFMFLDDELNVNRQFVELLKAICDLQEELGVEFRLRGLIKSELLTEEQAEWMYRAGFRQLLIGFESGSERILENIQKKATVEDNTRCVETLRKHGIRVKALMSIGHAGESADTVRATRDWLLQVQPNDFDVTIITVYPGTPYWDDAVERLPGVWTYTAKNGDRLHALEVDQLKDVNFYKGMPGQYQSFVYTDSLTENELVQLRDQTEDEVRKTLGIPYPSTPAELQYEHSMAQR